MAKTTTQLKEQATTIRNATTPNSNTAQRVGTAIYDIAEYLDTLNSSASSGSTGSTNNSFAQFDFSKNTESITIKAASARGTTLSTVILREASQEEAGIMTARIYNEFQQAKNDIATLKQKAQSPTAGAWGKWTKTVKIGRGQQGTGEALQIIELPDNAAPAAFFVSITSNNGGKAFIEGVLFASRSDNQCELRSARQIGAQIAEEVQAGVYYNGTQPILRIKPHPRRSPQDQEWTITVLCSDSSAKVEPYFAEQPMDQRNTLSFN